MFKNKKLLVTGGTGTIGSSICNYFHNNECGKIYDPVQIDFHHLNPKEKSFNISDLTQIKVSPKKLIKEIEKCVPLCANCHRLIESNIRKDYWYMKRIESDIKIDNIQES